MSMSVRTPSYDFTPYEVNRVGRVAPEQRYWLGNSLRMTLSLYGGLSLILPCAGIYYILDLTHGTRSRVQTPGIQVHDPVTSFLFLMAGLFLLGYFAFIVTCIGLSLRRSYTSLIRLRELVQGRVVEGVGNLQWHADLLQDIYVAQVGARRLFFPLTAINTLFPGSYRLFYLPQTGMLIAAERIGDLPPHFELLKRLSDGCGFTFEALAANRAGHLTPQQRRRSSAAVITETAITIIGIFGADVLFVKRFGNDWAIYMLPLLLFYLLVLMTSSYISRRSERRRRPVAISEGQVRKLTYEVKFVPTHFFEVEGKRFRVPAAAYDVLDESLRYRVYYLPRGNRLLSMEPVASEIAPAAV